MYHFMNTMIILLFETFSSLDSLPADIFHSVPIQLRSSICPSFVPFVSVAKKYEAFLVSVAYTCLSPLTDKASFITSPPTFPSKDAIFLSGLKKSQSSSKQWCLPSRIHTFPHTVSSQGSKPSESCIKTPKKFAFKV